MITSNIQVQIKVSEASERPNTAKITDATSFGSGVKDLPSLPECPPPLPERPPPLPERLTPGTQCQNQVTGGPIFEFVGNVHSTLASDDDVMSTGHFLLLNDSQVKKYNFLKHIYKPAFDTNCPLQ
jgi:hypothetical protein